MFGSYFDSSFYNCVTWKVHILKMKDVKNNDTYRKIVPVSQVLQANTIHPSIQTLAASVSAISLRAIGPHARSCLQQSLVLSIDRVIPEANFWQDNSKSGRKHTTLIG